tara:strand:- start:212 stop:2215 length:2004 start_codon:yes stop_codon:yes gene_type:complete
MKIKIRKDINGLRAIAVLSVILFHAEIAIDDYLIFDGGFVGVDIFFVISGYLITLLLLKELSSNSKISFLKFYERRARRIFPMLFFIIIISTAIGYFILSSHEFKNLSFSAITSLFFSSNFFFYFSDLAYNSQSSLLQPLLHTWSLSIEEQFYLLFPVFLIIFYKFFKFNIFPIFIIGLLLSTSISFYGYHFHNHITFYMLPTRAWELISGSLIAILVFKEKKNFMIVNNFTKNLIFFLSLLSIFLVVLFYNLINFNMFYAILISVVATCLILYVDVSNKRLLLLLSNRFFLKIGLISYSVYLWHFPIFAFARMKNYIGIEKQSFGENIVADVVEENAVITKFILLILTIFLSFITYRYVEQPFRNYIKFTTRKFYIYLVISFISILMTSSLIFFADGLKYGKRFQINNYILDNEYIKLQIDNQRKLNVNKIFSIKEKKNVLVIGNSHGIDFYHMLEFNKEYYPNYEFRIYGTQIRCLLENLKNENITSQECLKPDTNQNNDINIKNFNDADIIILSTRWHEPYDWYSLEKVYSLIKILNKEMILVLNFPEFYVNTNATNLVDEYVLRNKTSLTFNSETKNELEMMAYNSLYKSVFKVNEEVMNFVNTLNIDNYINPFDFMCDLKNKKCDFLTTDGFKIYYDYGHFSLEGAKYFGEKLIKSKLLNLN